MIIFDALESDHETQFNKFIRTELIETVNRDNLPPRLKMEEWQRDNPQDKLYRYYETYEELEKATKEQESNNGNSRN